MRLAGQAGESSPAPGAEPAREPVVGARSTRGLLRDAWQAEPTGQRPARKQ